MKRKRTNPIVRAPILKKGGAHLKSKSGQRSRDKAKLKRGESDGH